MTSPNDLTVTQLSLAIQRNLEGQFSSVRVRGEISGLKVASSGHVYFDLKDNDSAINSICWRGQAAKFSFKLADGQEVIARGKVTTYAKSSRYQLIVDGMEKAGIGNQLAEIEALRLKLLSEGLFAPERKPPLPYLPTVIGVITSPSGAVLQDIRHRISERLPRHIIVWPVLVQGVGAEAQIVAAIKGFNAIPKDGGTVPRPDLLIVARGGGSTVDLMPFNLESVVRAAAASQIPIISAIGHETDTTLIDFAASLRAPTPTAAAEKAVPERTELRRRLQANGERAISQIQNRIQTQSYRLAELAARLGTPQSILAAARQSLDYLSGVLQDRMATQMQQFRGRLALVGQRLQMPQNQIQMARNRLESLDRALNLAMRNRREQILAALNYQKEKIMSLDGRLNLAFDTYRMRLRPSIIVDDGAEIVSAQQMQLGQEFTLKFIDGEKAGKIIDKNSQS